MQVGPGPACDGRNVAKPAATFTAEEPPRSNPERLHRPPPGSNRRAWALRLLGVVAGASSHQPVGGARLEPSKRRRSGSPSRHCPLHSGPAFERRDGSRFVQGSAREPTAPDKLRGRRTMSAASSSSSSSLSGGAPGVPKEYPAGSIVRIHCYQFLTCESKPRCSRESYPPTCPQSYQPSDRPISPPLTAPRSPPPPPSPSHR